MADRAFNSGAVLGSVVTKSGNNVVRGAKASGHGIKCAALGAKDAVSSFVAGFRTGLKTPNQAFVREVSKSSRIIIPESVIIIVKN